MHCHFVRTDRIRVAAITLWFLIAMGFDSRIRAADWNEAVDGDLSNDRFAPSSWTLSEGSNLLTATMPGTDLDYVTVHVPAAHTFSGLTLTSYSSTDGTSFIGMQAGTQMTVGTGGPATSLLGYTHFGTGPGNVGQNILPAICTGPGSIQCTPPLPSGPYTFWIQQASAANVSYQFTFSVTGPPPNNGDYNNDGFVNAADYVVWRSSLGMDVPKSTGADGNNNGEIDPGDYLFWKSRYGEFVGGAGASQGLTHVPEPATWILLAGALSAAARGARRRGRQAANR